jgi:hypothetical protein
MQTDPTTEPKAQSTCGACGASNAVDASFCWKCYAPFATPVLPISTSGRPPTGASSRPDGSLTSGPTPPRKRRRPTRALVVVAVLVALGAYGATTRTHFEIPESIGGVPRMHDAPATEYEDEVRQWASDSGGLQLQGGAYGTGAAPEFVVGAVDEAVRNDPDDILHVVVSSISPDGNDVASLSGTDGSFEYRCVQAVARMSVCVWKESDNSGFVGAIGRTPQDALALTRTVRDAIEA